jgi:predicted permease
MNSVIAVALPVFAIIGAGFLAGRWKILPAEDVAALNRFVFRFAMPAALFGLTARAAPIGGDDLIMALAFGLAALIAILGNYAFARRVFDLSPQEAGAHGFSSGFGNAVFLGLPIAMSIPGWAPHFVVLMLVEGIGVIALGAALLSARDDANPLKLLLAPLRNPLVAAMILGLVFSGLAAMTPLALEGPIGVFFDFLGRAAGPTALFSMGLFLATTPTPPIAQVAGKVASIAIVKMVFLPATVLGALYLFGVTDRALLGAAALFTATPVAVGAFIMSSQYAIYTRETAAAVAASTVLALVSISTVLMIYAG